MQFLENFDIESCNRCGWVVKGTVLELMNCCDDEVVIVDFGDDINLGDDNKKNEELEEIRIKVIGDRRTRAFGNIIRMYNEEHALSNLNISGMRGWIKGDKMINIVFEMDSRIKISKREMEKLKEDVFKRFQKVNDIKFEKIFFDIEEKQKY